MLIGLPAPLLIHQHHQPSPKLMSKGHSDLPATALPPNPPPKMQPPGERAHPARRTAASQRENCLNFQTVSPFWRDLRSILLIVAPVFTESSESVGGRNQNNLFTTNPRTLSGP